MHARTRVKKIWSVALGMSLAFLSASASDAEISPADETTLARVGERTIRVSEFDDERARRGRRARPGIDPLDDNSELLEEMVRRELVYRAAQDAGYEQRPEVQAQIRQLIVSAYLKAELRPAFDAIEITEEDVEAYYRAHTAELTVPPKVRASVVQISVSRFASDENKQLLRERIASARSDALALRASERTFSGVAVEYSDDQSTRYLGGDMGWIRVGATNSRWPQPVVDAMADLHSPGAVSPVIETSDGFFLLKLMDRAGGKPPPLAAVRERVIHGAQRAKHQKIEDQFYRQLENGTEVVVNAKLLRQISVPIEPAARIPLPN